MVNTSDIDDNTQPRSADSGERRTEATVDEDGRKRNPIRTVTQEDIETRQQDDSKSNSTDEGNKWREVKWEKGEVELNGVRCIVPV